MSFYKKYELLRLIADGEAKTFRAIESATGRSVFLHLFNPGGKALLADLKAKLADPAGKPVPPLLEIGEFAGSQYAVTESSEPFSGLREWVDRQPEALLAASPAPPVPAPPKPAPRQPAPPAASQPPSLLDEGTGEFTRQFGLADPAENPPELFHPRANDPPGLLDDAAGEFHRVPPPSRPSGTMPATSAEEEMGDFTRAFGAAPPKAPERAKPPARLPPKPPGPPPAPPRRDIPTPPSPSAGWAASAPAARADDTGEFTKLFGSGLSGEAIDIAGEQAKAARTTLSENRPFQKAGEFTRIFGPEMGGEAASGRPPAAPLSLNTAASGVFGSPADLAKPVKDAPDAPTQAGSSSDPGEYTSVFGAKPGQSEAPKPPEAAKPPAAAVPIAARKPKMHPAAIAGVVAAVVVLIALIVVAVVLSTRSH